MVMNKEQFFEFVEWTSYHPWRHLPYGDPKFWSKICNDTNDPHFGIRCTTEELFELFKKEKGYE